MSTWAIEKLEPPAGLDRRPADYETFRSSQIAENTVYRESFASEIEPSVALVEQVSEQVPGFSSAPWPNGITAARSKR